MKKYIWMVLILIVCSVAYAAIAPQKIRRNEVIIGIDGSTDDKILTFDVGDGATNPKVTIDQTDKDFSFSKALSTLADTLGLGDGDATGDQCLEFDTGDAGSNKKLCITDTDKDATLNVNDVTLGDGVAEDHNLIFDIGAGASNPLIRWNDAISNFESTTNGSTFTQFGDIDLASINLTNYSEPNPNAELNVGAWAVYADAAADTPVDGTGGAPTITLTRTTSSVIRDAGSFLITKDAADRQGEGTSFDFTIEPHDNSQIIEITFEHSQDANYADDDIGKGIVTPDVFLIKDGGKRFVTRFTADGTDDDYRLIFHIRTTNALAYEFRYDKVIIQPVPIRVSDLITEDIQKSTVCWATVTSICTVSPCTITDQSGSCVTSITRSGTGNYTVNFAAGTFTTSPACNVFPGANSSTDGNNTSAITTSTSALNFLAENNGNGNDRDAGFFVICLGRTTGF